MLVESRGLRAKDWVQNPSGMRWLRKEPKYSRPFEVAIEALMLRLADEVGVNAALGSACVWKEGKAKQKGFRLLAEFPDERTINAPFRASYLFATFAQRIPSPKRRDFDRIMESWGVVRTDNALEVLARSGGIQMTDRIELLEARSEPDELRTPLVVRLAGMKKHAGAAHICVGELLTLEREPTNEFDTHATKIVAGGEKAGYVPRPYSALVARLLDAGVQLEARAVRQLGDPADVGRWVIGIART